MTDVPPPQGKTKQCECSLKMVPVVSDEVKTSNPPVYSWYWFCGCGRREHGGSWRERPMTNMDTWRKANGIES